MKSFLITYKPSNENPDLGWPVEELQKQLSVKGEPALEAVAITGQGVFDTLKEVAKLVLAELKKNS